MADKVLKLFGPSLASTTATTVFTNTAATATMVDALTLANPSGAAIVIRLSHGTDAAGTRVFEQSVPATTTLTVYPRFVLTGTEILQLSAVTTTNTVVAEASGRQWVV